MCSLVGSNVPSATRFRPLGEAGCKKLTTFTPCHRRQAGVRLWEAAGHCSRGGEARSEAWDTARAGFGVPGPARRPGQSGSQALGYLGRRAENGVEARKLHVARAEGKEGNAPAGPAGEGPWLDVGGLGLAWW